MRTFFLLYVLLYIHGSYGQNSSESQIMQMERFQIIRKSDKPLSCIGLCCLSDSTVLDTARFQVTYLVETIPDTTSTYCMRDRAILQIGKRYTKFFGLTTLLYDRNYTRLQAGEEPVRYDQLEDQSIDYEIYTDLVRRHTEVVHHVPFTYDFQIVYEEPLSTMEWHISGQTKNIAGYDCQRAEVRFMGRNWDVWFAPEISCSYGPWKLAGLPGLILEAQDSRGHHRFSLQTITTQPLPIVRYKTNRIQRMTKRQWNTFQRNAHLHPVATFGNNGHNGFIITDPKTGATTLLDDAWTIPYNPLELELY